MKKLFLIQIAFICFVIIFGCGNEKTDDTGVYITNPTCKIIEDSEPFCEAPMKTGIYLSQSDWDGAVSKTDVVAVLDKKDVYDETFFEENALVYMADTSSGNSQCKYEGFILEEVEGKTVLTIKISYSTDMLLNKLHTYHVFFTMDKSGADEIDEVKVEFSERK